MGKAYLLDGDPVDIGHFLKENELTDMEMGIVAHMEPGTSYTFGGGAWATFVLSCIHSKQKKQHTNKEARHA